MIASGKNELFADFDDVKLFFFPQDDVYHGFLSRFEKRPTSDGTHDWWDAGGVSEGCAQPVWSPKQTSESHWRLQGQLSFDQGALGTEAAPEQLDEDRTERFGRLFDGLPEIRRTVLQDSFCGRCLDRWQNTAGAYGGATSSTRAGAPNSWGQMNILCCSAWLEIHAQATDKRVKGLSNDRNESS